MPLRRLAFIACLPALLLAGFALAGLAFVALREAMALGAGEAWLMAWMLAFVVGLPLSLPVLGLARWWQSFARSARVVPHSGEKVPCAG